MNEFIKGKWYKGTVDDYYIKYLDIKVNISNNYSCIYYTETIEHGKHENKISYWANNEFELFALNNPVNISEIQEYLPDDHDDKINKINMKDKGMQELMLEILNKTYDNPILRKTTVPLFMSNPGVGKSTIIKEFAESKGVKMIKITLSQRMPNEVVGMVMPDINTGKLLVFDSYQLETLKNGDILFFDEVFNGTLKQTLDAVLNLLEDRMLPSGKKLANVMIVAASNHQGLINLTPQIKERFIKYDLKFNKNEFQSYLKNKYGMPESISNNLCILINKEKFEQNGWDFITPRSIEKAINQMGCDLQSPYTDLLLPYLTSELESPLDINDLNVKKGDQVPYLDILKLIIKHKNDQENNKQKSRVTSDLLN